MLISSADSFNESSSPFTPRYFSFTEPLYSNHEAVVLTFRLGWSMEESPTQISDNAAGSSRNRALKEQKCTQLLMG